MRVENNQPRNIAIYARVSTEHEAQLYALDNQIDWYEIILQSHPNWNIIHKYIDRGITGTSATKRPQFMQMIKDAESKEFDLIITREVSRFARNTVDTLQYTRQLKKIGIEVYFVEDNIWTFDADGELRLTIMATLAQDESRKTSLRVKAGQRASMEKGVFFQNGSILGYDKIGNNMVINPEQSATVKLIFDRYNSGMGVRKIQWELESLGRKTAKGSTKWTASVICRILKNKFYAGYIVWYKQFVPDFLEQKKINNHGEKEQFEVLGSHEPIVSLEDWELTQRRLEQSSQIVNKGRKVGAKPKTGLWTNKLRCSCGRSFNRKIWHKDKKDGSIQYGYQCYSSIKSGSIATRINKGLPLDGICKSPAISEWKLEAMALYIFKDFTFNKDRIIQFGMREIEKALRSVNNNDNKEQINSLKNELDKYNKKIDNLIEMRTDGEISKEQFTAKKKDFEIEISRIENEIESISERQETIKNIPQLLSEFKANLTSILNEPIVDKVPEYIIDAMVEYILVDENKFTWKLRYPSDKYYLSIDGSKKQHTVSESPSLRQCSTGCNTRNAEQAVNNISFTNDSILILFDKKMAQQYGNLKPTDRIHRWYDIVIEIIF